ncbi:MAG TPA: sigma-70 family RNA polymerase sigma factor [Terriglobales bacterium]|nr:sigma-70 family RNA polymerase sigma factor [Terriglobales bacterium]
MAARPDPPLSAPPVPEDERELVSKAQAGDRAAFEILVQRYERRIYRLALRMMGNQPDAEDVLQETFIKVYSKLHQFQQQSRLYTWIVRIAVNQALMKLRQRRGNTVSLDEEVASEEGHLPREVADWHPDPEQQYQSAELADILQRSLEALPLPYKLVFQLRDVEELSTEETAEALGLTESAVKSRLLRARLQLRARLGRHFRAKGADSGL